jgi:hypothetical protein
MAPGQIAEEWRKFFEKNSMKPRADGVFYFPATSSLFKSRALKPASSDFRQT